MQPMLLGLAVCLAVVAAAAFVFVGHPLGGGGASPSLTPGAVLVSPAVTSAAVAAPPAPTNFTATSKTGVPCPSADEHCYETDLAWSSTADPSTWFRIYRAYTGLGPATCLTVAAEAQLRLETKPGARSVSVFDGMAVGGGAMCWWITAVNSPGESAQVAAAGQPTATAGSPTARPSSQPTSARTGFSPTGSMATGRELHTATLLPDGRILVAGGVDGKFEPVASAELYDPKAGIFSPTGPMGTPRTAPTATLLPDGRVLVAGGIDGTFGPVASAELFDPATGTFSPTGSMAVGRVDDTATRLADGRVLIVGGSDGSGIYSPPFASAELYLP